MPNFAVLAGASARSHVAHRRVMCRDSVLGLKDEIGERVAVYHIETCFGICRGEQLGLFGYF